MLKVLMKYFNVGTKSWATRRRIIVVTLLFNAGLTIYAAVWLPIDKMTVLVNQCFTLSTFVIAYYVFGNVLDDHSKRKYAQQAGLDPDSLASHNRQQPDQPGG